MNLVLIFQEHLQENAETGKLDWKPGTPGHIRAAGAGYKKWLDEHPKSRLPYPEAA
jgi:hypothetical protein